MVALHSQETFWKVLECLTLFLDALKQYLLYTSGRCQGGRDGSTDQSSIPSTHTEWLTTAHNASSRGSYILLGLCRQLHTHTYFSFLIFLKGTCPYYISPTWALENEQWLPARNSPWLTVPRSVDQSAMRVSQCTVQEMGVWPECHLWHCLTCLIYVLAVLTSSPACLQL